MTYWHASSEVHLWHGSGFISDASQTRAIHWSNTLTGSLQTSTGSENNNFSNLVLLPNSPPLCVRNLPNRVIESWRLKTITKIPRPNPPPPCSLIVSLRATCPQFSKTSRDGDPTTSLSSWLQRIIALSEKNFSLISNLRGPDWMDLIAHALASHNFQKQHHPKQNCPERGSTHSSHKKTIIFFLWAKP